MLKKWIKAGTVYWNRRMLTMIGLGFSSGFPLLLVFGTFNLWLLDAGISLKTIGLLSLVKIPYSFKWVWAPLMDRGCLPLFSKLGRRRGWALFWQVMLVAGIWGMALTDPSQNLRAIVIWAVVVVFSSASQDIVLDAFRVESFRDNEQGAGAAMFVTGYRLGSIFSGAAALYLAYWFSWEMTYKIMSLGAVVGMVTILLSKEPEKDKGYCQEPFSWRGTLNGIAAFFKKDVYSPFSDFMKRANWALILVFIFLYRMSDAYMAPMANVFYVDMGFSKAEIASVSKIFGIVATIGGGIVGGLLVRRWGIVKALFVCGVLQGLSNLMFVAQAYAGHNIYMLVLTISIENISGGMGSIAFVAYISSLCNVAYTATQYALLSSLMSFARDVFASSSGWLSSLVGWSSFFLITTLMAVPGLAVLAYLQRRPEKA